MGVASGLLDQFSSLFGRRRSRAFPRLPDPGTRPAAAGRSGAGHRGLRLEDLAPAGRRHVQQALRRVRDGRDLLSDGPTAPNRSARSGISPSMSWSNTGTSSIPSAASVLVTC